MPTCYVTCGFPGCGKSTYVVENLLDDNTVRVSFDGMVHSVNRKIIKDFSKLYSTLENETMSFALHNKFNLIIDKTNLSSKKRTSLIGRLKSQGYKVVVVFFDTPEEVYRARNTQRDKQFIVPDHVYEMFNKHYVPPSIEEGMDEILTVKE